MTDRTEEQVSYLDMSDEELVKMGTPDFVAATEADAKDEEAATKVGASPEGVDEQETDGEKDDKSSVAGDQAEEGADDERGDSPSEKEAADDGEEDESPQKDAVAPEGKTGEKAEAKGTKDEEGKKDGVIDYKAEYERLTAPFKANGKDLSVQSVDDAISLMQMGANYNKKMAALKPNLKLMKMLENNGLLDEAKLSFLIDLDKKDPIAINKLVKDSGLDPMDLDADKASGYKQTTYTVDDKEIELDTVLGEIEDTPAYNRTLSIVGTKWDAASKQVIAQAPALMKVINDHVASGVYDIISQEVERERVFGRLVGLSDIDAYKQVGDSIQARGGFDHLAQGSSRSQGKPAKGEVVQPKPKQVDEDKLKEKRRAASSTKAAPSSSAPKEFNPLAMSDEEFAKQVNSKFL